VAIKNAALASINFGMFFLKDHFLKNVAKADRLYFLLFSQLKLAASDGFFHCSWALAN